jgi:signal transduction histidine kinase
MSRGVAGPHPGGYLPGPVAAGTEQATDLGRAEVWLRVVGLSIWAFVGVSRWVTHPGVGLPAWSWIWVSYGAAYVVASLHARLPRSVAVAALVSEAVAATLLPLAGLVGFEGLLLSIVVVQLPTVLPWRASLAWACAQLPLLAAVVSIHRGPWEVLEALGAYATFCAFGLLLYRTHRQEQLARRALAVANAEILAMRSLLLEGAREGERRRISRELHDSLGHQLTALRVQLELAAQLASGESAEALERASAVSQQAIGEVRRAVGALRRSEAIDLGEALRGLTTAIPAPRIHLAPRDRPLHLSEPGLAHAILRCAEEAITNAVRHAGAHNVWIDTRCEPDRFELTVRDDGRGAAAVLEGHGLTGMRERVEELGGSIALRTSPGAGFEVRIVLPRPESVR